MAGREHGIPSTLRAGLGSGTEGSSSAAAAQSTFIGTSMGLLKVFSEEAVKTAGEYALAQGRANVCHDDMRKALKYQARMFFQQVEDVDGRVDQAARELMAGQEDDHDSDGTDSVWDGNESAEEEEEEDENVEAVAEDGNDDDGEEDDDEEDDEEAHDDDETHSVSTSYSTSSASTVDASKLASSVVAAALAPDAVPSEAPGDEAELMRCRANARRVDAIVASWDRYVPTDPVLVMIKNAIDATDRDERSPRAEGGAALHSSGRCSKRKRA